MSATEPAVRIREWQARFDRVLEQRLPPETHHPQQLHQAMRYSALAGGKRFRPVLVYATGQAVGLSPEALDPVAAAIEIIHAYSLIHDDLPAMDDDDMRRGRPTCHRAFDEATAILAGDALQALAFEVLARELPAGRANSLQAVHLIARACGSVGMAGGQALDLGSVGRDISVDALETMHRLKTGALIRASVAAPCLLAEAGEDVVGRLEAYGDCVGLAFQVHDDILDVTGNSEVTGKAVLADAALDKPTFPSILGLDASRQRARELRDQAIDHLAAVPGDTSMLAWLAAYVIRRDR